jgi:hypothetical protein
MSLHRISWCIRCCHIPHPRYQHRRLPSRRPEEEKAGQTLHHVPIRKSAQRRLSLHKIQKFLQLVLKLLFFSEKLCQQFCYWCLRLQYLICRFPIFQFPTYSRTKVIHSTVLLVSLLLWIFLPITMSTRWKEYWMKLFIFGRTMTYRWDSDIFQPYGWIRPRDSQDSHSPTASQPFSLDYPQGNGKRRYTFVTIYL